VPFGIPLYVLVSRPLLIWKEGFDLKPISRKVAKGREIKNVTLFEIIFLKIYSQDYYISILGSTAIWVMILFLI